MQRTTTPGLHYTFVAVFLKTTSTCANCSLRARLMSPLETRTAPSPPSSRPFQRALPSHPTQSLRCRDGNTPLKHAIVTFVRGDDCPEMSDVAAYLRSIGAPE